MSSPILIDEVQDDDKGTYVGQIHSHTLCRHGHGVWTGKGVASGCKYEGEYRNHCGCGKGVHTWKDGRRYEGEFAASVPHGRGLYWAADGQRVFDGSFEIGRPLQGTLLDPDGALFYADYHGETFFSVLNLPSSAWDRATRTPAGRVVGGGVPPHGGPHGGAAWEAARVELPCGAVLEAVRMEGLRPCGAAVLVRGGERRRVEYDGWTTLAEGPTPVRLEVRGVRQAPEER